MIFIESPVFTADVKELLTDEAYAVLQFHLLRWPDIGDLLVGTGGLRKVRWTAGARGKRGGTRIIYYHVRSAAQIPRDKVVLRRINQDWEQ
jgi:hypothetical protein